MAHISLNDALDKISSDKVRDRDEGIADLKHVLKINESSSESRGFKDKTWHTMFEALFRVITKERSSFIKASKGTVKTSIGNRISACASVVRSAVAIALPSLRFKSLKAIVGHILQTLPTTDGKFCEPLCLDYLKALLCILSYEPHLEHLLVDDWKGAIKLCLDGIQTHINPDDYSPSPHRSGTASSRLNNNSLAQTSFGGTRISARVRASEGSSLNRVSLLQCLNLLTSASNFPVSEVTTQICETLLDFVRSSRVAGGAAEAFVSINACLSRTLYDSISNTAEIIRRVIPTIKDLWSKSDFKSRDEMLCSIFMCQGHIEYLLSQPGVEEFINDLENLWESLKEDFFQFERRGHHHLQLDDLRLAITNSAPAKNMPMRMLSCSLRKSSNENDYNWTLLHVMSIIAKRIDGFNAADHAGAERKTMEPAIKRRKTSLRFDEILRQCNTGSPNERTNALRITLFNINTYVLDNEVLMSTLEALAQTLNHSSSLVSSWAMLCISSLAIIMESSSVDLKQVWSNVWHSTFHLIASAAHCRVACHLINTLIAADRVAMVEVETSLDSMMDSTGLRGPIAISDSSLSLWNSVIQTSLINRPRNVARKAYETALSWIFSKWSPHALENKSHANQLSQMVLVTDLTNVLDPAITKSLTKVPLKFTSLSRLGRLWRQHENLSDLSHYLLLTARCKGSASETLNRATSIQTSSPLEESPKIRNEIDEFIVTELDLASESWQQMNEQATKLVPTESLAMVFRFCLVAGLFLYRCSKDKLMKQDVTMRRVLSLSDEILMHAAEVSSDQTDMMILLDSTAHILPQLTTQDAISHIPHFLMELAPRFSKALSIRREIDETSQRNEVLEFDSFGDEIESQPRHSREIDLRINPRSRSSGLLSSDSFYSSIAAYLRYISALSEEVNSSNIEKSKLPEKFIDQLTFETGSQLVSSHPFINMLLGSEIELRPSSAEKLLDHVAVTLLATYENERCESSVTFCVDLMTQLAKYWTQDNPESLASSGQQVYEWIIDKALRQGITTIEIELAVADLLSVLLNVRSDYSPGNVRSVRTILFELLQHSSIRVQYHIAFKLPRMFNNFVLDQHQSVFNDINDSLVMDPDWKEGIAIRLLVLARLASEWDTLLRRGLYHIFEAAGSIPESKPYAKICMNDIARKLGLENPKTLFQLFNAQMSYTWLEDHSVAIMPYSIFGYENLRALVEDAQDEIIGQLFMRNMENKMVEIESLTELPIKELVENSFARTAAYAFSQDICTLDAKGTASHTIENRLKALFTKQKFSDLLKQNFSFIVGNFFTRLDQEDQVEKMLSRKDNFAYANAAFQYMRKAGSSEKSLAASQQPSYRTKYMLEEIERLCRRVGVASTKIWTPFLVTTTIRKLLNDMNPVFGGFHLCRNIQRIRIIVSLAGRTAIEGYPLEMLLQALRPFVTHSSCAQDTIGIYQYLLEHGKSYLQRTPSVMLGTALPLFLAIREFLKSEQDSTTQETEHRATMSKAHQFHTWLGNFLNEFEVISSSHSTTKMFSSMTQAGRSIVGQGTSLVHTAEAKLLQLLLSDSKAPKKILSQRHLDLCLGLLCSEFVFPETFRNDIFGSDDMAMRYAPALWNLLQRKTVNSTFEHWAARVLGRSFLHSGSIAGDISRETRFKGKVGFRHTTDPFDIPRLAILKSLEDILQSESQYEVALAEKTLQSIYNACDGHEQLEVLKEHVSRDLLTALMAPKGTETSRQVAKSTVKINIDSVVRHGNEELSQIWIRDFVLALSQHTMDEPILKVLQTSPEAISSLTQEGFPHILHLILIESFKSASKLVTSISNAVTYMFSETVQYPVDRIRYLLDAMLYLRSQPIPGEKTSFDRNQWIRIDLMDAARSAMRCKMYKAALLFLDLKHTANIGTSTQFPTNSPEVNEVLFSASKELDEPDSFYGIAQDPNLDSIASRMGFEGNGSQELLYRSALLDSQTRIKKQHNMENSLISSVARLNLNGLTQQLASSQQTMFTYEPVADDMLQAAIKLETWDIATPAHLDTDISTLYRTYQAINNSQSVENVRIVLNDGLSGILQRASKIHCSGQALRSSFSALASLTETDEIFTSRSIEDMTDAHLILGARKSWMNAGHTDSVHRLLTTRAVTIGLLSQQEALREGLHLDVQTSRLLEAKTSLQVASIYRNQNAQQDALVNVAFLSDLVEPCRQIGLNIECAVKTELSHTLWDRGEYSSSINILRGVVNELPEKDEAINVGKAGLLATLGRHLSEARLEKPSDIMQQYLRQAQIELGGNYKGEEAGHVFHQFGSYCHSQLNNPETVEEMRRSTKFVEKRKQEVAELAEVAKGKGNDEQRQRAKIDRGKAKRWLEIDELEHQRLLRHRDQFLRQSLENYIMALAASDDHDTDVLRFVALWLEHADDQRANEAVAKLLNRVPTRKFAPLMNQLASRLQDSSDSFHTSMSGLVEQICRDHPYHGMNHVYAGSKTSGGNDKSGISRNAAAVKLAKKLQNDNKIGRVWSALAKANDFYIKVAAFRSQDTKAGARLKLRAIPIASSIENELPLLDIPPITMSIDLRADKNYSSIPTIKSFKSEISVAGGLSAPKILTILASDGLPYKELYKSGSDDLRQDAIMEQVFSQVSLLLNQNRSTRQRGLKIRTYNVIPLTANAGVIEFVKDTLPLNDFVKPAHAHYNPKDLRWDLCRTRIDDHRTHSTEIRVKVFKEIENQFRPVLRHFFFERFFDPDEWFATRLAYTRSTAAISILGHALGLGDRHCQNILLDESTGEVVHIDLGVAFEAGRILAVPEVVPFRLTRDIVDGFGIMGTEGVFRRCCEFTLEALRENKDAIMTLLNVLRYDPLYSWSMSPLRAKRLQEEQDKDISEGGAAAADISISVANTPDSRSTRASKVDRFAIDTRREKHKSRSDDDDSSGEADRALGVVEKKLAPGLSVAATVNELIQQATDERNLAMLFCGWAAYA